jgi:hypothetical protein
MFGYTLINSAKHVPILSEINMIRVFNFSALPFRLSFRFANWPEGYPPVLYTDFLSMFRLRGNRWWIVAKSSDGEQFKAWQPRLLARQACQKSEWPKKCSQRANLYIYLYIYIHGCDIHLEFSQLIDCDDLSRILYKVYNIFIYMIIYVYYIYKYIHRWLTSWCVVNNRLVCVVYCPSPSDIRIFFTGYTPPSRYVVFSRFWLEITHMYNITKDIIFVYITYIYTRIYITYLYIYYVPSIHVLLIISHCLSTVC